jgi:hypothetical protein
MAKCLETTKFERRIAEMEAAMSVGALQAKASVMSRRPAAAMSQRPNTLIVRVDLNQTDHDDGALA